MIDSRRPARSAYGSFQVWSAANGGPRLQVGQRMSSTVDGFLVWANVFAWCTWESRSEVRSFDLPPTRRIRSILDSRPASGSLCIILDPPQHNIESGFRHCPEVSEPAADNSARASPMVTQARVLIDPNPIHPSAVQTICVKGQHPGARVIVQPERICWDRSSRMSSPAHPATIQLARGSVDALRTVVRRGCPRCERSSPGPSRSYENVDGFNPIPTLTKCRSSSVISAPSYPPRHQHIRCCKF